MRKATTIFLIFASVLIIVSCESNKSGELSEKAILTEIKSIEDSLTRESKKTEPTANDCSTMQQRYISKLIEMYRAYPESEQSARSLDKVHMVYSGMGDYLASSKWADTLLDNFPNYINRALVLESQASTYDILLQPRDSAMVRKYYSQLLKEFPKLEKSKREDIEKRLKFNKLTFDQFVEIQILEDINAE